MSVEKLNIGGKIQMYRRLKVGIPKIGINNDRGEHYGIP